MTTPPDTPTPPTGEAPTGGRARIPGPGPPSSSAPPAGLHAARAAHALRACPRCASPRRWRRECWPSAWPSARRSAPRPSASFAGEPIPLLLPSIAALADRRARPYERDHAVKPPTGSPQTTPSARRPPPASASAANTGEASDEAGQVENTAERRRVSDFDTEHLQDAHHDRRRNHQADDAAAGHARVADHALGRHVRAGAGPAGGRALHRLPARARGRAARADGPRSPAARSRARPACSPANRRRRWTRSSSLRAPKARRAPPCEPETAGALSAADEFLKATVPSITSSLAYREHGLIVITFGTVGNATASSLPAGSATATLSSQPPVGVLLISPFAHAGTRPSTTYDPTSPKQSLSGLLH